MSNAGFHGTRFPNPDTVDPIPEAGVSANRNSITGLQKRKSATRDRAPGILHRKHNVGSPITDARYRRRGIGIRVFVIRSAVPEAGVSTDGTGSPNHRNGKPRSEIGHRASGIRHRKHKTRSPAPKALIRRTAIRARGSAIRLPVPDIGCPIPRLRFRIAAIGLPLSAPSLSLY